jgi:protein ImuA
MRTYPLPVLAAAGGGLSVGSAAPQPLPVTPAIIRPVAAQVAAQALVARLRAQIARLEDNAHRLESRPHQREASTLMPWNFGLVAVDAHLPVQGLARHGLHDVAPARYGDTPAVMGFALALAIRRFQGDRRQRPILWCRSAVECLEHGKLYGHGAERLGLPRAKLLNIVLKKQISLFWILEEALKSGCFSGIICDAATQQTDLTITRRLSLAAGEGRSSALIVFNRNYNSATASMSRWQVATRPSPSDHPALGPPAWDVTLSRIRGGRPGHWTLLWHPNLHSTSSSHPSPHFHASHHFSLVSGISSGTLPQGAAETGYAAAAPGVALRTG